MFFQRTISVTGLLSLVEDFKPSASPFETLQKKHSKFMVIKVHINRDRQYLCNIPFFFFCKSLLSTKLASALL